MDVVSSQNFALLRLCGDDTLLPDKSFTNLIEIVCQALLKPDQYKDGSELKSIACSNEATLKQCFAALMALVVECAKTDLEDEQLAIILDDCAFSQKRKESFIVTFNHFKTNLRCCLSNVGHSPAELIDVHWRLDYGIRNSQVHKVNELKYSLSLKQSDGENINFTCTREELQDLVGKLKEACKSLEKASQM